MKSIITTVLALWIVTAASPAELPAAKRILFLGDSITYGGTYIQIIEAAAIAHHPDRFIEMLNLGLSSETVSGLSEDGHAGGQFPRPDLHERLDRVLKELEAEQRDAIGKQTESLQQLISAGSSGGGRGREPETLADFEERRILDELLALMIRQSDRLRGRG